MEHSEPQQKNFKERVLESIATEDIKVYSKAHFALRMILLVMVAILTLLVSIFIFNYLFFSLRVSGRESLLGFGPNGIIPFLQFFPWTLLAFDIILIAILEWLLRKFRFGYRSPVLYLLLGIFAITISAGYFIDRTTGFNDALLRQADEHHLPGFFGDFYESARRAPLDDGVCKCTITAINGNRVSALDIDANTTTALTIIIPVNYPGLSSLKVGDIIFVAGTRTVSNTLQAFGVSPFPTDDVTAP